MSDTAPADQGVVGNSRLTATIGSVLLIALAVEGFTVVDVNGMFAVHAFVGMFLVPVALLKLGSTGYRFVKYYRRDHAYSQKGPPHPVLRVLGPLVVLSTVALLGTGVWLLARSPTNSDTIVTLHQASFIVWVSVTTVHVLGHIVETWRLTTADFSKRASARVAHVGLRRSAVGVALIVGIGLGAASLGWNHDWIAREQRHRDPSGRST